MVPKDKPFSTQISTEPQGEQKLVARIVHCSYHKCLTVYYAEVLSALYNRLTEFGQGYRHFNSLIDEFYQASDKYRIASVNNHALDLEKFGGDCRITRFIRDPRDLVVSGYFYHKSGAEAWCNIIDPEEEDWRVVNGRIPEGMAKGHSFSSYLQSVSKEDGLMAEIDFRKIHFNSMNQWPVADPRIKLFHYEDILGNEGDIFAEVFSHYEVSWLERRLGPILATQFSAKKQASATKHIRDPKPGQWKEHFTPKVWDYFERQHGEVLERYGYE
jgi:hypothetical protein